MLVENGPTSPLHRRRQLSPRDVAGHVERNLMHTEHHAPAIAGLAARADAVGCPLVLVAPDMVPVASRVVRQALVCTAIEFARPGRGALSLYEVSREAARFATDGARAIGLVWTAERQHRQGVRRLYEEVDRAAREFGGRPGLLRVKISCEGLSNSELTDAVLAARDAGATSLSAGGWCLPRQRMLEAIRLRDLAPEGCLVKWAEAARSLDVLLVIVAEGFHRVNGDPVELAGSATRRLDEGRQVVVPLPSGLPAGGAAVPRATGRRPMTGRPGAREEIPVSPAESPVVTTALLKAVHTANLDAALHTTDEVLALLDCLLADTGLRADVEGPQREPTLRIIPGSTCPDGREPHHQANAPMG